MVDPVKYKIFPRNLTARADYVVPGNPTNSRPESGVDNCYPGLEFDQRNLDQRFFPGLVFYFHRGDGARLVDVSLADHQIPSGLTLADITAPPLYLWGMLARHLVQESEPSMLSFQGQSGMEVWRRVHDILPGTVAIVFGPTPGLSVNLANDLALQISLEKAYASATIGGQQSEQFTVIRDENGKVAYAVFADQRATYLDTEGVIDPLAFPPGDITKTLCAPWMYDFRDCYCFYWSSNKPDIVNVVHDGEVQPYVNFLRSVADRSAPPNPDVNYFWKIVDDKRIQRRDKELTYEDLVEGWWQKLPVVLNDTEIPNSDGEVISEPLPAASQLEPSDIVTELTYLATVEHALTVEYLYAYYSINKTSSLEASISDDVRQRLNAAASQAFQIAVDEMRHLMWANLALYLIGAPASVGRAERIAEPPDPRINGRRAFKNLEIKYLDRPFVLAPLSRTTLDWFIQVEAPSKAINEGLDGMYVYILEALKLRKGEIKNAERVIPLIKLIIDEGEGHWQRFKRIEATLDGIPEEVYLRPLSSSPPNPEQQEYLRICDTYYQVILKAIELSLTLGETAQAQLVGAAVRIMKNLDEMAVVLAMQGYLPQFNLDKGKATAAPMKALRLSAARELAQDKALDVLTPDTGIDDIEMIYGRLDDSLQALTNFGLPEDRMRAARHRQQLAQHIVDVNNIILQDLRLRSDRL